MVVVKLCKWQQMLLKVDLQEGVPVAEVGLVK